MTFPRDHPGLDPLAAELGVTPALCLACVAASPRATRRRASRPSARWRASAPPSRARRDRGAVLAAPPGAAAGNRSGAADLRPLENAPNAARRPRRVRARGVRACPAHGRGPGRSRRGRLPGAAAGRPARWFARPSRSSPATLSRTRRRRAAEAGAALIDAIAGTCAGYPAATLAVAGGVGVGDGGGAGTTTLSEPRGGPSPSDPGGFRAPPPIRACPDAFAGGVAACAGASLAAVRLRNDADHPWVGSTLAPAAKVAAEALRVAAEVSEGLLVASLPAERGSTRPGSTTFSPLVDAVAAAWASRLGVNDDAASTSRDVPRRRFPRLDRVARGWTGACRPGSSRGASPRAR